MNLYISFGESPFERDAHTAIDKLMIKKKLNGGRQDVFLSAKCPLVLLKYESVI